MATESIANIRSMLDMWRAQAPTTPLLINTVPPSNSRDAPIDGTQLLALDAHIRSLKTDYPNLFVVDLYAATADAKGKPIKAYFQPDQLHLSAAGHARWAQLLKPALRQAGLSW
jgi:lysophospholipase L1-like esterase